MAGIKIHQYPLERTSFGDEDFYDIDYWDGTGYQSAKVKGSTLKSALGYSFIDIASIISGYTLAPTDAGKVITNSNTAVVRTLVINDTLLGVGNTFHIKGRVALQPLTGVNIDLPDGTTITEPTQYTCLADTHYILHRKASTGNDWVLSAINSETLSNLGSKDLAQLDLIREYEVFEDGTLKFVTNDAGNDAKFQIGEDSAERFGEIELNSETFNQTVAIQDAENNGIGMIVRVNPNEFDIDSREDISNPATRRNRLYFSPDETILEHFEGGRLDLSRNLIGGNTFTDFNEEKQGLKYDADYSADFVDRSLVDKGYVDASSKNIGNTDLTQTAGQDREYNLNSRQLAFVNSLRLKTTGNQSLTQFAQNFTTSVDDAEMVNNSIAPLLDNTTLDLFWKYKNNMGVVSDLFAKVDKSNVYGGKRYTLIKANGTQEYYDNFSQVVSNWVDGDTLHQFAIETITFSSTINVPTINWNGNGFGLICQGEITINSDFFLATGKSVNTCFLNLLFTGNSGANRYFVRGTSSNIWNGNSSTDISCQSDIIVMRETFTSIFLNINSNRNTGNAIVLSSSGGGAYFNIKSKGGVVGNGNKVYNSFFDDNFIDASGSFFNCYGSTLTSQMKSTNSTALRLYGCYLEVKTIGTLTTYNFNTSGSGILEMHDCTYVENQRRSFSVASSNCKFTNNKIYNYSGICGLFNTASFEFNNNYVYAKNLGVSSNSNSTANLINNFIISEVANPVGFGNFKILGGTLQVLTAAQNYLADNHEFVGVNFIGSTSPFPTNGYQNNAFRLTQNADHLGNVGLGLKSPFPKMTTAERDALTGVEKGYTIENTTTNFLETYNGTTWKNLLDLT